MPGREPITVEQLIARQGGEVGRRRAARTGEIPLPLGEQAPAHRRGRPPVPGDDARVADDARAVPRAADDARAESRERVDEETPGPRRGFPPVPGTPAAGPVTPTEQGSVPPPAVARTAASQPAEPAARPARSGLPPVPPLPGRPSTPLFPPLADQPGYRHSRPIAPLPPIPGRDVPLSGATRLAPPGPRARRAARRAARSPGRRRLIRAALGLLVVVGVVVAYHLGLYFYVDQSIQRAEALASQGPEVLAPRLQEGAATYLVVGTGLPGAEGPAGVATLLAHVSPDEQRAVLVSIPPTALVDTPACVGSDGELREPATEAFATSLLDGGPACMVRAVQQVSGLRVDHYLGVDLTRLPDMVDALGGVAMCLPQPTPAVAASAQPLPAGGSQVSGEQASAFLTPGDAGSDVTGAAVAERAQLLLTATLRTAMSWGTLGNPVTLTQFLMRASGGLTVDEDTNLGDLRTLAGTLGDLTGDAVQRTGLPVSQVGYVPAGTDQAYVLLDSGATRSLFDAVIDEGGLPPELTAQAQADAAAPAPPTAEAQAEQPAPAPAEQPLTVLPADVTVDVLNGTATSGLAATVADLLRGQGFGVGTVGNEQGTVNQTVVRYGPGAEERARTVAAAVPGSALQASDTIGDAVQLVIGPGYSTVVPVTVPPPGAAAEPASEAAAEPAPEAAAVAPPTEPASSSTPVSCG
ncbi:LCP family protein [Geodermatophilus sabuli]|uniref:LCP family protein n=1 Tax=Geodermatophilus sabuli TaxID=1564158 RepID=UPI00182EC878|nr:LCP family protein [Geodermatophilus sabuli]MBB3085067.1 LCP family protein required for cell wall assembly [Geodermatophilus sabuli]